MISFCKILCDLNYTAKEGNSFNYIVRGRETSEQRSTDQRISLGKKKKDKNTLPKMSRRDQESLKHDFVQCQKQDGHGLYTLCIVNNVHRTNLKPII